MKYEVLAIIAARGGSKGLPGKNIRKLLGKPLIFYTISEAKKSKLLTRFIVSTDSPEIARIARKYGAEVPFMRPKKFARDLTTDMEYLPHAVNWLKEHEGYKPDIILRLPPTSPMRRSEHIDQGIQLLIDGGDSLDSVRPIVESPLLPHKMWEIDGKRKRIVPFMRNDTRGIHEPWNLPRQKLPKIYWQTGAMDVFWRKTMEEKKSTSGTRVGYFLMTPEDSVDIDHIIDFKLAEILMAEREGRQSRIG